MFDQLSPGFDDPPEPERVGGESAEGLAARLAMAKAESMNEHGSDHWILASDTLCVGCGGEVLGTPVSRERAGAMLRGFVGAEHRVMTGVALLEPGGGVRAGFTDVSMVRWGAVSEGEIEAYLDSGQWSDKAGGYNLFDRQAAGWAIEVEGDPGTVVGLPMRRLLPVLAACGLVGERCG
ncbi:Maf-like protein YhdE [Mucisphaera calidilacus]|uniref:Maf-like protein YhdE n=1 Tax=Mucisphaera calidilacus TaxID=2527982 RepID=A0A518BTC8_9BACT|nr:Maf-like protein YhdE [Mucisphaera calidilacus]